MTWVLLAIVVGDSSKFTFLSKVKRKIFFFRARDLSESPRRHSVDSGLGEGVINVSNALGDSEYRIVQVIVCKVKLRKGKSTERLRNCSMFRVIKESDGVDFSPKRIISMPQSVRDIELRGNQLILAGTAHHCLGRPSRRSRGSFAGCTKNQKHKEWHGA